MADIQKGEIPREDELSRSGTSSLASDYDVNEKKLLAKLDWKLLPPVVLLYLLSFLDRSNGAYPRAVVEDAQRLTFAIQSPMLAWKVL